MVMMVSPLWLIGASALLNTLAQILLKTGLNSLNHNLSFFDWALRCAQNLSIFGGATCYGISLVLWLLALRKVEISYGVPLLSMSYVLATLAGIFFFKEPLSGMRILGVLLILGGIYCVARSTP
jgi:multidrug transporter EmrE-like cation transporter